MRRPPPQKHPYKIEFENEDYIITKIPLNYMIKVKLFSKIKTKKGKPTLLLPQVFYSPDDRNLEYAKETAEYMINKYKT